MATEDPISPLEEFVLAESPQGLGYGSRLELIAALIKQDPTLEKASFRGTVGKYFKFGTPLNDPFKLALLGLAHDATRVGLRNAIERHEAEQFRRDKPIKYMSARLAAARRVIFLGLEPISANLASAPASLNKLLSFSFQENVSGNLHLTMGVPDSKTAVGIWKAIAKLAKDRAKIHASLGNAEELLAIADTRITLFVLPRRMCVHTTFVFDPGTVTERGHIWYMPWDWRSLGGAMPPPVLHAWKEEYLKPIEDRILDGTPLVPIARTQE